MSDAQIGYAGLTLLLILIGLRVPIGLSLISVSFGGIWFLVGERAAWSSLGVIPYSFAGTWQLSSIPMFVLMGFFCYHAGLTKGLFEATRMWLSRLPGGLAISAVFGSAGFAAVTGSSLACAAAMGRIAVPEMFRYRYDQALATGTVAAAGTIGALIPPSILFILYGIIAQVPVGQLFLGGVAAGVLTMVSYIVVIMVRASFKPELAPTVDEQISWGKRFSALKGVWAVMVLIIGVLGGLFSGLFTPTEAGGVGAFLSLVIALIKRSITWQGFWDSITETLKISASIFIIAIGASLLTRFMAFSGAGDAISEVIGGADIHPAMLLLGITVIYLLLGMFLEPIGAMLLTLPIILPIIQQADFNLLWFGVLLAKFLEIGMITPPIGLNVFVIKSVVGDKVTTSTIFRGLTWFLLADLIVVLILIVFPGLVLYLPHLLK